MKREDPSGCATCRPLKPLLVSSLLLKLFAGGILLVFLLASCSGEQEDLAIGDPAPGFTLRDLEGNSVSLADFAGLPVIVRFVLTDCKYCRADTPLFNTYHEQYGDNLGVVYIESQGVNPETLENFAKSLAITFPVLRDPKGKVAASYTVRALPQTIVLDPGHKIIAAILGGVSEAELEQLLAPYLAAGGRAKS